MLVFSSIIFFLVCIAAGLETVPASFEIWGESGVTVMHAALLSNGKLAFLDKVEDRNKVFQQNGSAAYCCVYDPDTNDVKPLSAVTNPFCCAGAFLSDGRLITIGGNGPLDLDPNVFDGFDAIRYLDAEGTQNGWDEPGHKLSGKRWYASAQVMPDGTTHLFLYSNIANRTRHYLCGFRQSHWRQPIRSSQQQSYLRDLGQERVQPDGQRQEYSDGHPCQKPTILHVPIPACAERWEPVRACQYTSTAFRCRRWTSHQRATNLGWHASNISEHRRECDATAGQTQ